MSGCGIWGHDLVSGWHCRGDGWTLVFSSLKDSGIVRSGAAQEECGRWMRALLPWDRGVPIGRAVPGQMWFLNLAGVSQSLWGAAGRAGLQSCHFRVPPA